MTKKQYLSPKIVKFENIKSITLQNGDGGDSDGNGSGNTYAAPS